MSSKTNSPDHNDYIRALQKEKAGDWHGAHDIVDAIDTQAAAHIHAYLHRKEGDQWNANYWYRRANQPVCTESLAEEWQSLYNQFKSL